MASATVASATVASNGICNNDICNEGIRELANGLFERFNVMEVYAKTVNLDDHAILANIHMPLDNLSLSNTAFTDFGFKYFLQRLEGIHLRKV